MVIRSLKRSYEVLGRLNSTGRISEFLCFEQNEKEVCLLVRMTGPARAKRFLLFLEEKIKETIFPDYKECFQTDKAFYAVFSYSQEKTLMDKLSAGDCTVQERAEIVRRLLEQMLLRSPHPYFMICALRPDLVTVSDSLNVSWNYDLDGEENFDAYTMEEVCLHLIKIIDLLLKEEIKGKQYPLLDSFRLALSDGKMNGYLELYREFMPVYDGICRGEKTCPPESGLKRLWEKCKRIVGKPDCKKGYLRLGHRYVAKKLVLCASLIMVFLLFGYLWIDSFWIQPEPLIKTMVINSRDMEGYTGEVRLVGDEETDSVIFEGMLLEGKMEGQGTLYDEEGNLIYEGNFIQGMYEGNGTLYYPSGNICYRGDFSQDLYDGTGTLFYENGITAYEGAFVQGKRSGSGTAYDEAGVLLYEGTFFQDLYSGTGKLYSEGALIYEGEFLEGQCHGSGKKYRQKTGQLIYDGMFKQGQYSGEGRLYNMFTGVLIYEGSFYQDLYDGEGKQYDPENGELIYAGSFYQDFYDGYGKQYDPKNGYLLYKGEFREGCYDGQGKRYIEGMLVYDGEFFMGTYNGKGTLYNQITGAVIFEGIFYQNTPMIATVPEEQEVPENQKEPEDQKEPEEQEVPEDQKEPEEWKEENPEYG